MSRSYRTQKESVAAKRRARRDHDGSFVLPRIVEHKPAPGDIHPMNMRLVTRMLRILPIEAWHGLSQIEIRAREGAVGKPFGFYRTRDRSIVLYSLPLVWQLSPNTKDFARTLGGLAEVKLAADAVIVSWSHQLFMTMWFQHAVFLHELGHHFDEQYHCKNGRTCGRRYEELVAVLHAGQMHRARLVALRNNFKRRAGTPDKKVQL